MPFYSPEFDACRASVKKDIFKEDSNTKQQNNANVYLLMRSDVWGVDDYPLHAFFALPKLSELKRIASEFIEYHGEEFIATEETLRDGYSKGDYYCQVSSSNYYLYLCEIPAS